VLLYSTYFSRARRVRCSFRNTCVLLASIIKIEGAEGKKATFDSLLWHRLTGHSGCNSASVQREMPQQISVRLLHRRRRITARRNESPIIARELALGDSNYPTKRGIAQRLIKERARMKMVFNEIAYVERNAKVGGPVQRLANHRT